MVNLNQMGYDMRKGFTIIELIVVMVVIGIIILIAIPKTSDMSYSAKVAATKTGLSEVRDAINLKYLKNRAAGSTIPWPFTLTTGDFRNNSFPMNKLNGATLVTSVMNAPSGTAPTSPISLGGHGVPSYYGWWIIGTQYMEGRCGAYSDGTTQTSDW